MKLLLATVIILATVFYAGLTLGTISVEAQAQVADCTANTELFNGGFCLMNGIDR